MARLEEYERVKPDDQSNEVHQMPAHYYYQLLRRMVWLVIGLVILWRTDIIQHLLAFPSTPFHKPALYLLAASVTVNVACMAYLVFVVRRQHGPMALRRWRTFAPRPVQVMTGANVLAFVAAVRAFYPVYGRWSYGIVFGLSWSWLNFLSFF